MNMNRYAVREWFNEYIKDLLDVTKSCDVDILDSNDIEQINEIICTYVMDNCLTPLNEADDVVIIDNEAYIIREK